MSLHFYHTLKKWQLLKNQHQWVLGAVIQTQGSVYRKAGALMLLSDAGHQLGLLSGGCLESDLLLQARKVIALGKSRKVVYDASDEDGIAWKLGIGCGGRAEILLLPCNAENNFLQLDAVLELLQNGKACSYTLDISGSSATIQTAEKTWEKRTLGHLQGEGENASFTTLINPPPHLFIMGCGIDMAPLSELALALGWQVTVVDHRLTPQKKARFPEAAATVAIAARELPEELLNKPDAAIVAHHNMQLDADAIGALQNSSCRYIGLLGPRHRWQDVLGLANLNERDIRIPIAGPSGLALGGDLPESVALSMLAEIHAVLHGSSAKPLSNTYLQWP